MNRGRSAISHHAASTVKYKKIGVKLIILSKNMCTFLNQRGGATGESTDPFQGKYRERVRLPYILTIENPKTFVLLRTRTRLEIGFQARLPQQVL